MVITLFVVGYFVTCSFRIPGITRLNLTCNSEVVSICLQVSSLKLLTEFQLNLRMLGTILSLCQYSFMVVLN